MAPAKAAAGASQDDGDAVSAAKRAEAEALATPAGVKVLATLVAGFASGSTPTDRLPWMHACRRVLTQFYHQGLFRTPDAPRVEGGATGTGTGDDGQVGSKRKRAGAEVAPVSTTSAQTALSGWLHAQFDAFRTLCLMEIARKPHGPGVTPDDPQLIASLAALRTLFHFTAHGVSMAMQRKRGGTLFAMDHAVWLLRRLLSTRRAEELSKNEVAGSGGAVSRLYGLAAVAVAFSASATTLRVEYCDEYDDARYYVLRAIATLAQEKANHVVVGGGKGGRGGERGGGTACPTTSDPWKACAPADFARNAIDLLLQISLPPSQADWEACEHGWWVQEQWATLLPEVYPAADGSKAGGGMELAPGVKVFSMDLDSDEDEQGAGAAGGGRGGGSGGGKRPRIAAAGTPTGVGDEVRRKGKADAGRTYGRKWAALAEQRRAYGDAWLAVLRLPLPADIMRRTLSALRSTILPSMPDHYPLLMADFLSTCYSEGGANAVLALESLFYLMQEHGLEYPRFYSQLYATLNHTTIHAKYRARFFKLLDLFLSSAVLPAYLVAAFVKRTARLCLTAATPFALFAVPFMYNCVKRHAAIAPMWHRAAAAASPSSHPSPPAAWPSSADPFNPTTNDPSESNALASSLWEVTALQQHQFAPVANLARLFLKPAMRREYDIVPYSQNVYAKLVDAELVRVVRMGGQEVAAEVPFAFVPPPPTLFGAPPADVAASTVPHLTVASAPDSAFDALFTL